MMDVVSEPGKPGAVAEKKRAGELYRQAMDGIGQDNWEKRMIPLLREAFELDPLHEASGCELGYALIHTGQLEEAKNVLVKVLVRNPQSVRARRLLEGFEESLPGDEQAVVAGESLEKKTEQNGRQAMTTVIGWFFVIVGGLTALGSALFILGNWIKEEAGIGAFYRENLLLLIRMGLFATGVAILERKLVAKVLLAVVLLLTCVDSIWFYISFMPPVPEGLSAAGRAGREFGHYTAPVFTAMIYLVVLNYLVRPRSRREFGDKE